MYMLPCEVVFVVSDADTTLGLDLFCHHLPISLFLLFLLLVIFWIFNLLLFFFIAISFFLFTGPLLSNVTLELLERGIVLLGQLLQGPLGADVALVHHQDGVHLVQEAQVVRHQDPRLVLQQPCRSKKFLKEVLRHVGVNSAERVVE